MACECNVSELIAKHLMQNTFSYKMLQQCSTCEWTNQETAAAIEINTKPMYEHGIHGLQEAVDQKIKCE